MLIKGGVRTINRLPLLVFGVSFALTLASSSTILPGSRMDRPDRIIQGNVVDRGLGGVMIWELSHDVPGGRSVLAAIHETVAAASLDHLLC